MNSFSLSAAIAIASTCLLSCTASLAQHANYAKVRVGNGPTLEYPAHWLIADDAIGKNLVHSTQALIEGSGVKSNGNQIRDVVLIESRPRPAAAVIDASIVRPQQYSQADLRSMSPDDLRSIRQVLDTGMRQLFAKSPARSSKIYILITPDYRRQGEVLLNTLACPCRTERSRTNVFVQ